MRLKDEIERELGIPIRLRAGGPGTLDVFVDGERIYSKKQTGRFPQPEELLTAIRARMNPATPPLQQ